MKGGLRSRDAEEGLIRRREAKTVSVMEEEHVLELTWYADRYFQVCRQGS